MSTQSTRRFVSALLLFAMVFGMFGFFVPPASACQPNKPCADAPGQVKQDAPVVVTVDAKDVNVVPGTLTNNGGNTVNGNGNGVVNQALQGTNNATVTIQVTSLEEAPQLPANTNATIIVVAEEVGTGDIANTGDQADVADAGTIYTEVTITSTTASTGGAWADIMDGNGVVGPEGKPQYCTSTTINTPMTYAEFVQLARDWSKAWDANGDGVAPNGGWAHYVIPVYSQGPKGWSVSYTETSNSDNELQNMRGGWPNISDRLWKAYNSNQVHFPNQVQCPTGN